MTHFAGLCVRNVSFWSHATYTANSWGIVLCLELIAKNVAALLGAFSGVIFSVELFFVGAKMTIVESKCFPIFIFKFKVNAPNI